MKNEIVNRNGNILIYNTEDGKTKVEAIFEGNTVWLTQDQIAELFQKSKSTINEHLQNIFDEGELDKAVVMTKFGISEFSRQRPTQHYNLDAILAVGYRVKSPRGIQFRKWASGILSEYIKKGFAMNDEVLKNAGGGTYFRELLDRIRDIRSSEKVFYRQVLDLFATSIDYDPKSEVAKIFFKEMQNKLLFTISRYTAAELIADRANAELPFMGLQAFKGNRPVKSEVTVAKNYLTEDEIKNLNLMVSAYLDIAEMKAREQIPMYMKDWVKELEEFIIYRKKPLLADDGRITHEEAIEFAESEYNKYKAKTQDKLTQVECDFLDTIRKTYELLEHKKVGTITKKRNGRRE
uniref:Putative DNA-binding protein in cluster with Type I restriction-modification system n=1 Tax=uncultured bacterium contig00093 TaxID=1181564 RepID=A0A806K0L3_9BACT|nr:putative DNA-binding protein in cluster with Type I restriction-modification system [uncultured bacterium contig00093]